MGIGAKIAEQYSHKITRYGSSLTLPSGATLKAMDVKDERKATRYLRIDDINAPEKLTIVVELTGSAYTNNSITPGMVVTWEAIKYLVEGPLHPEFLQDVCTRLYVVMSKN